MIFSLSTSTNTDTNNFSKPDSAATPPDSTNNNINMASSDLIQVPSANKAGDCPAVQCGDPTACKSGIIVLQVGTCIV